MNVIQAFMKIFKKHSNVQCECLLLNVQELNVDSPRWKKDEYQFHLTDLSLKGIIHTEQTDVLARMDHIVTEFEHWSTVPLFSLFGGKGALLLLTYPALACCGQLG